jgi:toxoflavin biosynthesis protein ToxC
MLHEGPIAGIAAHGDFVATAGYDNKLILWNNKTRTALARGTHDHLVNNCAFSADGQWLVSASSDYSARVWALPSMRLQAVLPGHGDDVDMAMFSPDDQLIATCALDRMVRIFNLQGQCLTTCQGHTGNVLSLAWTPDSKHVVSTSVDGTIRKWDVTSGHEVQKTDLKIRTDSLEISSNGVIYAGDDLGRLVIIDQAGTRFVEAHAAGIKKVALNTKNGHLVCLSYDRTMSIWDVANDQALEEIGRTTLPETIWARAATILEDGRVATGTFGATYAIFDVKTSTWDLQNVHASAALNDVANINGHIYSVGDAGKVLQDGQCVADMGSLCNFLVASGDHIFTGGQMGQLFDARTAEVLYTHHSPLNCGAAFTHAGQSFIAIGSYTGEVLVFHVDGKPQLEQNLKIYENAIKGLSFSDGVLFSVCANTDIAWHRVSDWSLVKQVRKAHDKITNDCCAIDGHQFATVSRDRTLRIWSDEGAQVYPSPHLNSVKCISISDDKSRLLTGSYGGTVAMFDLNEKRWTKFERPTMSGISSITWDSKGQFLASSYDGHVYPIHA